MTSDKFRERCFQIYKEFENGNLIKNVPNYLTSAKEEYSIILDDLIPREIILLDDTPSRCVSVRYVVNGKILNKVFIHYKDFWRVGESTMYVKSKLLKFLSTLNMDGSLDS